MDPDDRSPRREPYFARLWRRAVEMAPLFLLAGVLIAWVMATDALSLGGARREAELTSAPPRAMPSDASPAALPATFAPSAEATGTAAQEAITPPAAAGQGSPTGESAPPAPPAAQGTLPAAPSTETPALAQTPEPAIETATILAPEATIPLTAGPESTTAASPSATTSPTETPITTAAPTSASTPQPPPQTGWTAYGGEWSWREPGVLAATTDEGDALWLYEAPFGDFTYAADVQAMDREAGLALRMQDQSNGLLLVLIPQGAARGEPGLYLIKRVAGADTIVGTSRAPGLPWVEDWATLAVDATGDRLLLYFNGSLVLQYEDSGAPSFDYGRLGLHIAGDEEEPGNATFRNIRLPSATP